MDCDVRSDVLFLAMAELRYRKDFVVLHRATRDGRLVTKRTPALTYWQARKWMGMTEWHGDTSVELTTANRQTLGIAQLPYVPK